MRTMIDLGSGGPLQIIDTAISVECGREVRFRRSFRSLVECIVPACCGFPPSSETLGGSDSDSTVTGTFFGHRKGRVSFCIQDDIRRAPLLLLELGIPTSYLAKEMEHGFLRVALECDSRRHKLETGGCPLYEVPLWCMYCNGRKVGYAMRRQMTVVDVDVLKLMRSVSVGAGVIPVAKDDCGELMYLRASFDRVIGSADSESFHMINPVGSSGQELSVFLLRS